MVLYMYIFFISICCLLPADTLKRYCNLIVGMPHLHLIIIFQGGITVKSLKTKWEYAKRHIKKILASATLSNVLAIISFIFSLYAGSQAINAIQQVNEIQNTIDSLNITSYSQNNQNAQIINNSGANYDDIKSISNAQFSNEMDKSYETFDILQKVADNPNLHFALVWYGTQEELDNSDLSEFPGNVTLYVTED